MSRPFAHETNVPSLPLSGGESAPARDAFTGLASILLHAVALAAILVVPLLTDEPLPDQFGQVKAFFAEPIALAPPPPPPPPAPSREAVHAWERLGLGGRSA